MKFVFFGGEPLGVPTLDTLHAAGFTPSLVVCNPDRPAGRGQQLTPPPVKVWAEAHNVPVYQPTSFAEQAAHDVLMSTTWDVFVVVAYNKILPTWVIEMPTHNTVNVHPSLLPKLRGASPIRSAILRDLPEHVGVSIMKMEAAMDSGPLLAQQRLDIDMTAWPPTGPELDAVLAQHGADLLVETLPRWVAGDSTPTPQKDSDATYCGKLTKDMAELAIDPHQLPTGDEARQAFAVIQAFMGIGNAWFMHKDMRYKITNAHLEDERLVIDTVVPAGKSESEFSLLLQSHF